MKNTEKFDALYEQFMQECEVIEMRYEYGKEFTGEEKYGIITDLSTNELERKYSPLLSEFEPYILLSQEYGEVRKEFIKNNKKFEMRAIRGHLFSIDDQFEEHHPEFSSISENSTLIDSMVIKDAIERLPEDQKRRIIAFYYKGYSALQIAQQEGLSSQAIDKSLAKGRKNLKKFLEGGWNLTSPSGNK